MSWLERLNQAQAELAKSDTDPLREKVETTVRGMDAVSTHALLDLIGLANTTGNGRRIAYSMRALGFVPIKSRRFMPGATVTPSHAAGHAPSAYSQLQSPAIINLQTMVHQQGVSMTYWYRRSEDESLEIFNVETRSLVGHAERHGGAYHVKDGNFVMAGVVWSKDDTSCALADHYKKHSQWRPASVDEYRRWTEFGMLQVAQAQTGCWTAYRNAEQPLMRDDEVATFLASEDAQRAADAHCGEGERGPKGTEDGFYWFMFEKIMQQ